MASTLGSTLGGMGAGAAMGGTYGAPIGPWGAAAGAGIGGVLGGLGGYFGQGEVTPEKTTQLNRYQPWQEAMMKQGSQMGMDQLQQMMGQPGQINPIEAEYMRRFQQQTVPGLAERFSGVPTAQGQQTSAFGQQMGQAGQDLQTRLAALRFETQQKLLPMMIGMGQQPMQENFFTPQQQQPGFTEQMLPGAGAALGRFGGTPAFADMFKGGGAPGGGMPVGVGAGRVPGSIFSGTQSPTSAMDQYMSAQRGSGLEMN